VKCAGVEVIASRERAGKGRAGQGRACSARRGAPLVPRGEEWSERDADSSSAHLITVNPTIDTLWCNVLQCKEAWRLPAAAAGCLLAGWWLCCLPLMEE
jgi:hypothetical protein